MLIADDTDTRGGQVKRSHTSKHTWSVLVVPGLALAGMAACGGNSATPGSAFDSGPPSSDAHLDGTKDTNRPAETGKLTSDANNDAGQPEACAASSATANVSPVDIFMVLDRSGSMGDNNAWVEEVQAIESFVYDINSAGIGVGLQYMPLPALCDPSSYAAPAVSIAPLPGQGGAQAAQIITSLTASRPFGGTPMVPALEGAIQIAKARQISNPDRDIVIVLSTDGLPDTSCSFVPDGGLPNSTQNAIAVLQAAATATPPIKTFVIGIGPQPSVFNNLATAGGTGSPILVGATDAGTTVDIEAPLIQALASIRTQALPCEYSIPQADAGTIDFGEVNVTFTQGSNAPVKFYGVDNAAACQANTGDWYYDNPQSPKHIELCPSACTTVKAATHGTVNVVYGCEATQPPPAK
jgi:Mg-chelatase subunit ChlD